MTPPEHLNRTRAVNHRRSWIGFGAALFVCSAFFYWAILDADASNFAAQAAIRRVSPGSTICFSPDPLKEIKRWICGINVFGAVGIIVRGLMIRIPAA